MKKLIAAIILSAAFSTVSAQFESVSLERIRETEIPVSSETGFEADKDFNSFFYVDRKGEIPAKALEKALDFYKNNQQRISNKRFIAIADFTQHSSNKRLYIVNMENGQVKKYLAAHGKGSDANHDGYAGRFSNEPNSNATSLGFYLTAETYQGKHGYSLRLDGLENSNSNARDRDIVFHGADYVVNNGGKIGRSLGCPAVENALAREVIDMIKGGALYLAWHENFSK